MRWVWLCLLVLGLLWGWTEREQRLSNQVRHAKVVAYYEKAFRSIAEDSAKTIASIATMRVRMGELVAGIDARVSMEVRNALDENERERSGVAAGTVRVRYVAASCPRATSANNGVPEAASTSGLDDGAGIELSREAGQDVLALRAELIRDRAKITGLQEYIRAMRLQEE
ncbi:hypothetical protein E8K88_12000 [Lampropedia aestuarii]|uniref:Lysis protein n=1 Tax=Lampropedia aestuarii TaxID=2562762 RepID=A0A4S5BNE0_9BURK|nr:lysis system i-spanin subunit Rz [Lampropedia aestuarii]THJ32415.1 hypothetical protein E8K88_12000 [Lampropedia aestuarii]